MVEEINPNEIKEKKAGEEKIHWPRISALLAASFAFFGVLYGLLKQIVRPEQLTSSMIFGPVTILIQIIKFLMVLLIVYILALVLLSFIYLFDFENKQKEGIFKFKGKLIKFIYEAPFDLAWILGTALGLFIIMLLIFMLPIHYFLISFLVFVLFVMLLIFKKYLKNIIWDVLLYILALFVTIIIAYILINMILLLTSNVTITLDKEQYFQGDNVYAKIFASGLLKDLELKEVYYSPPSIGLLLANRTQDFVYKSDPFLVKVNSSNLTSYTPNSYLLVVYNYGMAFILPKPNPHVKIEFVPVFNYSNTN